MLLPLPAPSLVTDRPTLPDAYQQIEMLWTGSADDLLEGVAGRYPAPTGDSQRVARASPAEHANFSQSMLRRFIHFFFSESWTTLLTRQYYSPAQHVLANSVPPIKRYSTCTHDQREVASNTYLTRTHDWLESIGTIMRGVVVVSSKLAGRRER